MSKKLALSVLLVFFLSSSAVVLQAIKRFGDEDTGFYFKPVVKKEERKTLVDNEFGEISAVDVGDGVRGPYHIRFFTLGPNSLLLPQLLHADMVFFVHTGSGKLTWVDEKETKTVNLKRGDIFGLQTGSVFFVQSDLQPERESLRIYALFSNKDDDLFELEIGAYSSIRNLVRGFDKTTLKQAFKVPDEVIESITSATDTEDIVHAISTKKDKEDKKKKKRRDIEDRFSRALSGVNEEDAYNKKKKSKGKGFNLFEEEHDFENCNGWSLTVSQKKAGRVLGETNIGLFMVNLTKGSMMGPHWNSRAAEIAVVLQGRGMIRVVCSSSGANANTTSPMMGPKCKNRRFMVKEGDVFAVPRFHPMAQMSFNNDSLVFMGFSTTKRKNYPQFLAGKRSVLQVLDGDLLTASFNVPNTTIDRLRAPQAESVILDCTSCAEEQERKMVEEREREKEEEAAREREKEEEERRKREEEEEREREKREEEERRKREEEEARKREEEARKREEEEEREREKQRQEEEEEKRKREEEEARKREEEEMREREKQRQEEEEEERSKREEEEARKREEEEEIEKAKQRQEEEERRKMEEEEARKREEEEEIEKAKQRQEEEERRKMEEEEARKREEEEERESEKQRQEEEEEEEEEERKKREEEEARKREEEEEIEREKQRQEEDEEEERRKMEEEEARKREEEEREKQRQEEEERQSQEAEERERERQQEEERARQEDEERERQEAEEEARRQQEEQEREQEQERQRQEEGGQGRRAFLKMWAI